MTTHAVFYKMARNYCSQSFIGQTKNPLKSSIEKLLANDKL